MQKVPTEVQVMVKFEHRMRVCKWGFQGGTHLLDACVRANVDPERVTYVRDLEGKATTGETLILILELSEQDLWRVNALAVDADRVLGAGVATITVLHNDGREDFSFFNTRALV